MGPEKFAPWALFWRLCIFIVISVNLSNGQIRYTRHLSELRIQELHRLATSLNQSVDPEKYACDSFYDYVCGGSAPMFSVLGNMPPLKDLIKLQGELEVDGVKFPAKEKALDFFISCNRQKTIEQCYRETFVYFKPLFGYVITKNHIEGGAHEHDNFHQVLQRFLKKAQYTDNFSENPVRIKLISLRDNFLTPHKYFQVGALNDEYQLLNIYRDSYEHNVRNLELLRRRNSTYEVGDGRTILDWTLYVYQSQNKPMSFYFSTLTPHLWMAIYNTTERNHDFKYFTDIAECLKLPQFVNVLEEARVMTVIYLKSFRKAWEDYIDWKKGSNTNQEIYNQENDILKHHNLSSEKLFFTFFAQSFCDFGKELAENVFYPGIKHMQEFYIVYACGHQTEPIPRCV